MIYISKMCVCKLYKVLYYAFLAADNVFVIERFSRKGIIMVAFKIDNIEGEKLNNNI